MKRRTALALIALTGLLGCGGSNSTPTAEGTVEESLDAMSDSHYVVVLTGALANATKYCVRKLGASIGAESPPSDALRKAERRLPVIAAQTARERPDLIVDGKSLADWLFHASDAMSTGQCDNQASMKLEDLALKLR